MAIYGAVLARDPRWFEPHYLLALANYQQGNAAEAYRLVSRALEPRALDDVRQELGHPGDCASFVLRAVIVPKASPAAPRPGPVGIK